MYSTLIYKRRSGNLNAIVIGLHEIFLATEALKEGSNLNQVSFLKYEENALCGTSALNIFFNICTILSVELNPNVQNIIDFKLISSNIIQYKPHY